MEIEPRPIRPTQITIESQEQYDALFGPRGEEEKAKLRKLLDNHERILRKGETVAKFDVASPAELKSISEWLHNFETKDGKSYHITINIMEVDKKDDC